MLKRNSFVEYAGNFSISITATKSDVKFNSEPISPLVRKKSTYVERYTTRIFPQTGLTENFAFFFPPISSSHEQSLFQ